MTRRGIGVPSRGGGLFCAEALGRGEERDKCGLSNLEHVKTGSRIVQKDM